MRALTADERDRRFAKYVRTLHQGEISELILTRLNRISNFRKQLLQLVDEITEARAQVLAASMLMEGAPPRPEAVVKAHAEALTRPPRRMPKWVEKEGRALKAG